ncbi:MAG: ribonuclease H-like domain-containing protein, partial [Vicinamibacteraceae bacterium]
VRGAFHRMEVPLCDLPHLDLLPAARRLWRTASLAGDRSCRLIALEQALVGLARDGDVPGWEIPGRYFAFIRRGDPSGLAAVFHHNRFDLLTLAALTARARYLVQNGVEAPASAGERLGLARLYQRAGRLVEAEACYRAAAEDPAAERLLRASAWRGVAMLDRRARRYAQAAEAWEQVVALEPREAVSAREAREALAIYHEHRAHDLEQARRHARFALTMTASEKQRAGVEYRLARLEKKIARRADWSTGRLWELSEG